MDKSLLPIIIVGAGPVGLSLATALISRGIAVKVFEKELELSPEARASTFHPRTLEMFNEWGVINTVLASGYQVDYLQYWERDNRQLIAQFDYKAIANDTPFPFRLQCPQSVLTRVLKPHVETSPYGDVYMGHEFISAEDKGDHVAVTLKNSEGEMIVKGRFLCGADGAHSLVRDSLGIEFIGMTYRDRFLLIASDIDFSQIFENLGPVSYIFDPQEWVIILQLPDVTRIVFRIPEEVDAQAVQESEAIRQRIQNFIAQDIDFKVHSTSIYNVHQRVASRLREGNIILLGDAAHINNPMGGMGMNSGIHDAYHLTDFIERILAGESEDLLDEYSDMRRYYALNHIQQSTDKNYQDMSAEDDSYREKRNQSFRSIAADPARMRDYLIKRSMLDDRIQLENQA
ncbi:NAD(P)/FAD-dependent oxidoreductase [Anaerolineales bacterium]